MRRDRRSRRSGFRGGGARGPRFLDLFDVSKGTFARPTEASYLTRAPTDGSVAFVAWAPAHVRRVENRGDGSFADDDGDALLIEGGRTNLLLESEGLASAPWAVAGSAVVTADQRASPDAVVDADDLDFAASVGSWVAQSLGGSGAWPDNEKFAFSCFQRALVGQADRLVVIDKSGGAVIAAVAPGATWARHELLGNIGVGAGVVAVRAQNASDGIARKVVPWGAQYERAAFPSSYVRAAGVSAKRDPDELSYAPGEYPASFLTMGGRLTFAPDASSSEIGGSGFALFSTNSGNALVLQADGSLFLATQNTLRVVTPAITWARGQALTIEWRPGAGQIAVSGATTGNGTTTGTACAIDAGTALQIGRQSGIAREAFGRYARHVEAL